MDDNEKFAPPAEVKAESSSTGFSVLLAGLGILAILGLAAYPTSIAKDDNDKQAIVTDSESKVATTTTISDQSASDPVLDLDGLETISESADGVANSGTSALEPMELENVPTKNTEDLSQTDDFSVIAVDPEKSASFAISRIRQSCEPESAIEILKRLKAESTNETTKRLLTIHLADLYDQIDDQDQSIDQLRSLILEEN